MSIVFPFDSDPLATVASLRELADDLERLTMFQPNDLNEAPLLTDWTASNRLRPCLEGTVIGHPRLGDRTISTSELFAIDRKAGWARTFSRFYRLSPSH
jgi:hypothetical protein